MCFVLLPSKHSCFVQFVFLFSFFLVGFVSPLSMEFCFVAIAAVTTGITTITTTVLLQMLPRIARARMASSENAQVAIT